MLEKASVGHVDACIAVSVGDWGISSHFYLQERQRGLSSIVVESFFLCHLTAV